MNSLARLGALRGATPPGLEQGTPRPHQGFVNAQFVFEGVRSNPNRKLDGLVETGIGRMSPAPQRGARAIVTDAGRDAVDAAALGV